MFFYSFVCLFFPVVKIWDYVFFKSFVCLFFPVVKIWDYMCFFYPFIHLFIFPRSKGNIPMIPLGLKETKEIDFREPFKVGSGSVREFR